jgi:UDP:flavonoid glycosyltransferase YjiC (YdhE family)
VSRLLLTTFGSYGDLHPYLAMAQAFRSAGHEVVLATHSDYQEFVERAGAEFVALRPSLADAGPEEEWTKRANHPRNGSEYIVRQLVLPYLQSNYDTLIGIAPRCDVVLSHILTFATPIVAEKLRKPWLSVALQPSVFLSVPDPPALGPLPFLPSAPKWFVRSFYWLAHRRMRSWFVPVDDLRQSVGLPPGRNPMLDGFSPYGTLALFPSEFASAQPDWPAAVTQLGFPLFDMEHSPHLSPEAQAFLDSGEPPVVFTLGSSIARMQSSFFKIAHEAVRKVGRRAVFLAGVRQESIQASVSGDRTIFVGGYEPFSQLFPHSAAIVHQCGIGTTAQALASGRPQVAVPFAHDQPDNARRIVDLGLGVAVPAGKLNAARLARALSEVLKPEVASRAEAFARRMPTDGFEERLQRSVSDMLMVHQ